MKILLTVLLLLISTVLSAKDIQLVVPFSPGGVADQLARLVETELSNDKYTIIVNYKVGAGGAIGAKYVADTKNGTVLMLPSNGLITAPMINPSVNYDPLKDFILVKYLGSEPLLLVVKNDNTINNFGDFIKLSKTSTLPYGSAGIGTSGHLAMAAIAGNNPNFIHVPYKGASPVIADLLNGNIKWTVDSDLLQNQLIASGKTKPIAVYYSKRLKKYPNVPTVKELGINDYNQYRWHAIVANATADPKILLYVNSKLSTPHFLKKVKDAGLDTTEPDYINNFFLTELVQTRRMLEHINLK